MHVKSGQIGVGPRNMHKWTKLSGLRMPVGESVRVESPIRPEPTCTWKTPTPRRLFQLLVGLEGIVEFWDVLDSWYAFFVSTP